MAATAAVTRAATVADHSNLPILKLCSWGKWESTLMSTMTWYWVYIVYYLYSISVSTYLCCVCMHVISYLTYPHFILVHSWHICSCWLFHCNQINQWTLSWCYCFLVPNSKSVVHPQYLMYKFKQHLFKIKTQISFSLVKPHALSNASILVSTMLLLIASDRRVSLITTKLILLDCTTSQKLQVPHHDHTVAWCICHLKDHISSHWLLLFSKSRM